MNCYCCSGLLFSKCCQPLLNGGVAAASCLQLMRSRYSAYCSKHIDYIFQTYHPDQRAANAKAQIAEFAQAVHFIGLSITGWSDSAAARSTGSAAVSFVARYITNNKLETLTEQSRFVFSGSWYYYDGDIDATPAISIGRNDSCPCGSGKKFKQCTTHVISGTKP